MIPKKLSQLWESKVFRFLVCGGITAIFNVVLLVLIIKLFGIKTPFWRNLANIISIEISVIFSFFVYRSWVWSTQRSTLQEMVLRQIPTYHLSVAASFVGRSLLIFPALDWLGVHYIVNTLIGIILGSIINYKISDRWVFSEKKRKSIS
jgi:dolichol-phosphate mannosyltransferase